MKKISVLFLCVHNSARSQMAEAYMKMFGNKSFDAQSAGLEPGSLNPLVVKAMKEDGIDISGNRTKDVFELHRGGSSFDYVITVCDMKNAQRCPVFPGMHRKITWDFEDPSSLSGTDDEKMTAIRAIRNKIKESVQNLVKELA